MYENYSIKQAYDYNVCFIISYDLNICIYIYFLACMLVKYLLFKDLSNE